MENENESEIVKIRKRLDKQDDDIRDILILLRGSSAFGVMGMQSMVSDISKSLHQMISDIQHLQRWKKMMQESKVKFRATWQEVLKTAFAIIGAAGTIVGMYLAIKGLK